MQRDTHSHLSSSMNIETAAPAPIIYITQHALCTDETSHRSQISQTHTRIKISVAKPFVLRCVCRSELFRLNASLIQSL